MPPTCTYCHRVGHTVEICFVKRSNEAVQKQHVRFAKNSEPSKAKGAGPSGQNNIMFVKEDDPIEEEITWQRSRGPQMKKHLLSNNGRRTTSMLTLKRR